MREAYSLLRQSIIHVEQDDIDFDEEELRGERDEQDRREKEDRRKGNKPKADTSEEDSQDVEMSGVDSGTIEESEQMLDESIGNAVAGPSHVSSSRAPTPRAATPQPPRRRMIITHDKYMQLQSLIVLHLSQIERETGRGMDRDDLIDWYLELKEAEMNDVEDIEYEKELITKMLRKLVRVSSGPAYAKEYPADILFRIITSSRLLETFRSRFLHSMRALTSRPSKVRRTSRDSTWCILQLTSTKRPSLQQHNN